MLEDVLVYGIFWFINGFFLAFMLEIMHADRFAYRSDHTLYFQTLNKFGKAIYIAVFLPVVIAAVVAGLFSHLWGKYCKKDGVSRE